MSEWMLDKNGEVGGRCTVGDLETVVMSLDFSKAMGSHRGGSIM